jgi:hypothetical protein
MFAARPMLARRPMLASRRARHQETRGVDLLCGAGVLAARSRMISGAGFVGATT